VQEHADEVGVTTTTSAPPAPQAGTTSLNVSADLARACDIHFGDIPQAPKFDFDRSEIRADDGAVLGQIATCLTTGPLRGRAIQLIGRADPRGEVEYNLALGGLRASSVERYLRRLGVDPGKMVTTSRGKLDATGTDEPTWQQDRRVDVDLR
jgi:peptidoglycan-associated lipoprotein